MAEVWFAIPSASVERCRERLPEWRRQGYHIAVLQNMEAGDIPADRCLWSDHYPGWAESINILCRDVVPGSADLVVSGGDDMLPDPHRTAQQLADDYFERFPDGFGVMQPAGDTFMWAQNYCGSPWFGRKFFETMYEGRGPMWGGYAHNWADNELFWVARCLGKLWMRDDAHQYHAHFTREGETQPAWWTANVADKDLDDCALFLQRKYAMFPGHQPKGTDLTFDRDELLRHGPGLAEWRWTDGLSPHVLARPVELRVEQALQVLADRGKRRVAIYGAGTHTRRAAQVLADPPVEIVAIIDDRAERHGSSLWGFPIVSFESAETLRPDAILLSSDAFEHSLWQRCAPLRARGVDVVRLYAPTSEEAAA